MWTWSLPGSDGQPGVLDEPLLWLSARCISAAWSPSSKTERRGEHLYCRWSPNYVNGLPPAAGSTWTFRRAPCPWCFLLERTGAGVTSGTLDAQLACLSWHVVHHVFHFELEFPVQYVLSRGLFGFICACLLPAHGYGGVCIYVRINMLFPSGPVLPEWLHQCMQT